MAVENPVHWHVIYTRARHERKVAALLTTLEIEHYLPTIKTMVRSGRKKKLRDQPLFPSYVFVRPGSAQCYLQSLSIPGVLHYVKTGKEIARVAPCIVERLQLAGSHDDDNLILSDQRFQPGASCDIQAGPFAGLRCEVVQHHGSSKIIVRIDLLQRSLLLDLPAGSLIT